MTTRKGGAQPGNKNAFKHGIYAKRFTPEDAGVLVQMGKELDGEIALLRVHINGLALKLEGTHYGKAALSQLYCMGDLIMKVANIVRIQAWLTGRITTTTRNAVTAIFMDHPKWEKVQQ
ncbi:MAG: hypothetical protein MUO30_04235 [Anaerolineales bacterium]|nr:hypothetical protein [Anaerolineales bacterium]